VDVAKAGADAGQTTIYDAKWAVAEDVGGVLDTCHDGSLRTWVRTDEIGR
jgi:hypothetical protein